jgi:DNA-directed RNA polymerase specialized sigma24 family protein
MAKTFVNGYKNLDQLQEKKPFKSFLIGTMLHECASKSKILRSLKAFMLTVLPAEVLSRALSGCLLIPWDQYCFLS